MDGDFDTNIGTTIEPGDTPEARWTAWAIWSAISLVIVLFAVLVAGFDAALLLGWAVGIIVAAMLMVFGRY
jgi:hypothetical protein